MQLPNDSPKEWARAIRGRTDLNGSCVAHADVDRMLEYRSKTNLLQIMENMACDSEYWTSFWHRIATKGTGLNFRDELITRYSENHRAYHTIQHVNECLNIFKSKENLANRPEEVFFAIWYHDAIYEPRLYNNEAASANLAENHLSESDVDQEKIRRISELILVTEHTKSPVGFDQQLIVDIDLAILGSEEARFSEYEKQIEREYSFVPKLIFNRKRKEVLSNFLARPNIYNTPYFFKNLENRARLNLTKAVS